MANSGEKAKEAGDAIPTSLQAYRTGQVRAGRKGPEAIRRAPNPEGAKGMRNPTEKRQLEEVRTEMASSKG